MAKIQARTCMQDTDRLLGSMKTSPLEYTHTDRNSVPANSSSAISERLYKLSITLCSTYGHQLRTYQREVIDTLRGYILMA